MEPQLRNPGGNEATLQKCKRYGERIFSTQLRSVPGVEPDAWRLEDIVMGRFIITAVVLCWCSSAFAQGTAPSMGSSSFVTMGGTSTVAPPPPGASAAAAALDGAGVPLGATDLFVGGLSPSATDLGGGCPSSADVVALGTGAIFSGDGTLSMSGSDLAGGTATSGSDCSIAPTAGDGPLGVSSMTGDVTAFGGGNIPLAATALPTAGLGGTVLVPGSISSCSSTGASASAASPMRSPLQNPLIGLAPGAPTGQVC